MTAIHPPRPDEVPERRGHHRVRGAKLDLEESWEVFRQPDGSLVWRVDQKGIERGREVRRLGHAIVRDGHVERLQVHQRTPAGLHRQTYTFYDDGALLTDNRVPGRHVLSLEPDTLVVTPFVSLPLRPRGEGSQPVLWVHVTKQGLLTHAIAKAIWEDAGQESTTGPIPGPCERWHLSDPWGVRHTLWLTAQGLVVRWEHPDWQATLTGLHE